MNPTIMRNQTIDFSRGIAILLVVLGHAIQYCSGLGKEEALGMSIGLCIYSFHVPLFMLVSGWLFCSTVQRHSAKDIVLGRIKTFAWPILTMTAVHVLMWYVEYRDAHAALCNIPFSLVNSLWFLWALAIATVLMCVVLYLSRDRWWGYVLLVSLTFFVPDGTPTRAYMFLIPFFVTGYLSAKYKTIGGGGGKMDFLAFSLALSFVIYGLSFMRFGYADLIYQGRYSILGDCNVWEVLCEDAYRYLIGVAGSVSVILLLHLLFGTSLICGRVLQGLSWIGRETLAIYVFQDFIFSLVHPFFSRFSAEHCALNVTVAFIVVTNAAIALTRWAHRNRWASLLFLGKPLIEKN